MDKKFCKARMMSKAEILDKLEEVLGSARVNELFGRKQEEEKKISPVVWVLAVIGAVAAVAAIAYAVYRYLIPDYLEDFEDDFDDDFEDDFFEDEESEKKPVSNPRKIMAFRGAKKSHIKETMTRSKLYFVIWRSTVI